MNGELPAVEIGEVSDQGQTRPDNEDCYGYQSLVMLGRIFVVADGVGGEYYGREASELAVNRVIQNIVDLSEQSPRMSAIELLTNAIVAANADIYSHATQLGVAGHMGTTLVVGLLRPDLYLYVAWVGDSRLYVTSHRRQKTLQITRDHTEVDEQRRSGMISEEQARYHPRRNVLSRSVGGQPDVYPEFAEGQLEAGDLITLCTDGLTRYVSAEEINDYALKLTTSQDVANILVKMANERGGKDNITALVVHTGLRVHEPVTEFDEASPGLSTGETGEYPLEKPALLDDSRAIEKTPSGRPARNSRTVAGIFVRFVLFTLLLFASSFLLSFSTSQSISPSPEASKTNLTSSKIATLQQTNTALALFTIENIIRTDVSIEKTMTLPVASSLWISITTATSKSPGLNSTHQVSPVTMMTPVSMSTSNYEASQIQPQATLPAQSPTVSSILEAIPAATRNSTGTPGSTQTAESARVSIEPYPAGTVLIVIEDAEVYQSIGVKKANFILPTGTRVTVIRSAKSSPPDEILYYNVHDQEHGPGWVNSEVLIEAAALNAILTAQAEPTSTTTPLPLVTARILPTLTPSPTIYPAAPWLHDEQVIITFDLPALNMHVQLDDNQFDKSDNLIPVDNLEQATLISDSARLFRGHIWWNIRLADGRNGWLQQIYLQKKS